MAEAFQTIRPLSVGISLPGILIIGSGQFDKTS